MIYPVISNVNVDTLANIANCTPIMTSIAHMMWVRKISGAGILGTIYQSSTIDGTYTPLRIPKRLGGDVITTDLLADSQVLDPYIYAGCFIKIVGDAAAVLELGGRRLTISN